MKTAKEVLEAGLLPLYENYATFDLYADAALAALRDAGYTLIKTESVAHENGRVIATGVVQWMGSSGGQG